MEKPKDLWWVVRKKGTRLVEKIPDSLELMPVLDGWGFYGVLLADRYTGSVQCHICGKWRTFLGGHVRVHGITADEYKETFELGTVGLCSPEYSNMQAEKARTMGLAHLVKHQVDIKELKKLCRETQSLRHRLISAAKNKTDEGRRAVSEGRKQFFRDNPEALQRQQEWMKEIRLPDEVMAAKMRGRKKSPEHCRKVKEYAQNRTPEHQRKLVAYAKNRSPEHKKHLREHHEHRRKETRQDILYIINTRPGLRVLDIAALIGWSRTTVERYLHDPTVPVKWKRGYVWPIWANI